MSSPHLAAGKRPRSAGMEGSTIVVPNKSNNDDDSSSSSIIIMLANACKQHLDQHEREGTAGCTYHENEIPTSCRKALDNLSRIIPKMEKAYSAGRNPNSVDVMHLCDFYLSVTQNNFCPAALKLFNYGRKPVELITRVMSLLEHVLSSDNRKEFKAQWRRPGIPHQGSFLQRLCHTAATLLGVIAKAESKARIWIFHDLVHTIYDLSVLIDLRYFARDDAEPVEIVLFAETLQRENATEIALHVDSLDATKLLQATLLKILPLWVGFCRLKQLETFPDTSQSAVALSPDSAFATFLWSNGHLDMSNDATMDLYSVLVELVRMPMERSDYRDGLRRHAAIQVMQALLQDFQTVGAPELHIVLYFSKTIVETALDTLKTDQETKVADALADCIRECISIPPRVDGWSLEASQLAIRRATCPPLLDCVPLLPDALTMSAQNLGTAVLDALGKAFDRPGANASSLSLGEYPRSTDPDFLSALFDLMEDPNLAKHAVWICALAVDCANEAFGSLYMDSTVSNIFDQYNKAKVSLESGDPALERTRKRRRSERAVLRKDDSPSKRYRSQRSSWEEVGAHRVDLVQSCIVDFFSFAMLACNKEWSTETHSTTDGIDALAKSSVVASSAVQILVLTQCLNCHFTTIAENLVAYLEGLFQGLISMDITMTQVVRDEVESIAIELSTSLRANMGLIPGSNVQRLLEFADSITLARRGFEKITKGFLVDFPFAPLDVDEGRQISRVRLLRYKLKCAPPGSDTSNDAMQMTLELLRGASFYHADPFVRLLLWQAGAWLLRTSTDIERHLAIACDNREDHPYHNHAAYLRHFENPLVQYPSAHQQQQQQRPQSLRTHSESRQQRGMLAKEDTNATAAVEEDDYPPPLPEPKVTFRRRVLPEHLVALSSPEGQQALVRAMVQQMAATYFMLTQHWDNQSDPASCGVTTLRQVLNAAGMDPTAVRWKGGWRYYGSDSMVVCRCMDPVRIQRAGITLPEFVRLAHCHGLEGRSERPDAARTEGKQGRTNTVEDFRNDVLQSLRTTPPAPSDDPVDIIPPTFLVVSFSRAILQQTGDGHFSTVAAYDAETDSCLVLDVARFKYPPYWVSVEELFEAMRPIDPVTKESRGWSLWQRAGPWLSSRPRLWPGLSRDQSFSVVPSPTFDPEDSGWILPAP